MRNSTQERSQEWPRHKRQENPESQDQGIVRTWGTAMLCPYGGLPDSEDYFRAGSRAATEESAAQVINWGMKGVTASG